MYKEMDLVEIIKTLRVARFTADALFADAQSHKLVPYFKWYEAKEKMIKADPFW